MSDTMTETAERVTVTLTGGVADVRLNRPEKRNALDPAMFEALVAAGERLKAEPGLRAVVLSGEGPDFCAGLDFGSFQAMRAGRRLSATAQLPPSAGPARAAGQGGRPAGGLRMGRASGSGDRGGAGQRPRRRTADLARGRHPDRRT
jgi:enoyl-CoA hydratase/carnithine racemase